DLPGPDEVIALLYTSGSTGTPKGVCMTHDGVRNFIVHQKNQSTSTPGTQNLLFSHLSFDASLQETLTSLSTGATLHIVDDTIRLDVVNLLHYLDDARINRAFLPYVTLQHLCETAGQLNIYPSSIREITTGGELLKITSAIRHFFKH